MRFTIKFKLAAAFGLIVVLLVGIAIYGMINLGSFNQTITDIVKGPVERLKLAQQVSIDISDGVAAQKSLLLAATPTEIETYVNELNASRQDFDTTVMQGEQASDDKGKQIWEQVRTLGDQFDDIGNRIALLVKQNNPVAARQLAEGEALTVSDKVHEAVASLIAALCMSNPAAFHRSDAAGYVFWADRVLDLDGVNPQLAARLARVMDRWTQLAEPYRSAAAEALRRVAAKPDLSSDVAEIIHRALQQETTAP